MGFDMSKVGHRIRVARAEACMSQDELAFATGLHVDSVRRYEPGGTWPTLEKVFDIAIALGVSIDKLCDLPAPGDRKAG